MLLYVDEKMFAEKNGHEKGERRFRVLSFRVLSTRKFLDGFSCSGSYNASDTKTLGHETRFRVHFFCALGPIRSSLIRPFLIFRFWRGHTKSHIAYFV